MENKRNNVLDVITERSSIRAYTAEKLTESEIDCLKQAALASPTARNTQHLRYFFITDEKTVLKIEQTALKAIYAENDKEISGKLRSKNEKLIYGAPLFVMIFGQAIRYGDVDAGIAVQSLALAAQSMGLGSVILGMPRAAFLGAQGAEFQKSLGIGSELEYKIGIAIGHPAAEKAPHTWNENHIAMIE